MPPAKLRVGIDGRMLSGQLTGVGLYVFEICQRLMLQLPDVQFFVYSPAPTVRFEGVANCTYRIDTFGWASRLKLGAWALIRAGHLASKDKVDVFWGTCHFIPLLLPRRVKKILTIHDLVYKECPSTMTTSQWASHAAFFPSSLRRSDYLVANSKGTANRLHAIFGRTVDGVAVPGVPETWRRATLLEINAMRQKYQIPGPYILAVSTIEPRKNYGQLIKAFLTLRMVGKLQGYTLVIVGRAGWKCHADVSLIESNRSNGVVWLGFVDSEDLSSIYSGAELFVFPSIYEGYGIPAAEARACSVNSLLSNLPELHESGGTEASYAHVDQLSLETAIAGLLPLTRCPLPPPIDTPRWRNAANCYAGLLMEILRRR